MKENRWLLPCTFGVNLRALDLVFRLAQDSGATLVPASLIVVPDTQQGQELLPARRQQSEEFLKIVQWKAAQYHILVEPHEIWTSNVQERMKRLVFDLQCDSIVFVTEGKDGVLLSAHEMKDVFMGGTQASLVLVRLHASNKGTIMAHLRTSFSVWVRKLWSQHRATERMSVSPIEPQLKREHVSR